MSPTGKSYSFRSCVRANGQARRGEAVCASLLRPRPWWQRQMTTGRRMRRKMKQSLLRRCTRPCRKIFKPGWIGVSLQCTRVLGVASKVTRSTRLFRCLLGSSCATKYQLVPTTLKDTETPVPALPCTFHLFRDVRSNFVLHASCPPNVDLSPAAGEPAHFKPMCFHVFPASARAAVMRWV